MIKEADVSKWNILFYSLALGLGGHTGFSPDRTKFTVKPYSVVNFVLVIKI